MTLTRNRSLDKTRDRAQRRTAPIGQEAELQIDTADPARQIEVQDLTGQVRQFMEDLPEKQRLVMHLRDIEELSYEEIAQVLDISLDQVKVNLHRARKAVRMQLQRVFASEPVQAQNS